MWMKMALRQNGMMKMNPVKNKVVSSQTLVRVARHVSARLPSSAGWTASYPDVSKNSPKPGNWNSTPILGSTPTKPILGSMPTKPMKRSKVKMTKSLKPMKRSKVK